MKKYLFYLFVFFSVNNYAQNLKVGYIDTDELLALLPEVKLANDSIKSMRARHEKKIQNLVIELRTKASTLESKKAEIAPVQYQKEVELLKSEESKIIEFDELGKKEIQLKSNSFSEPLESKVNNAIKEVSLEEGYNYIINMNNGFILYADEKANILEKVKAKLIKK